MIHRLFSPVQRPPTLTEALVSLIALVVGNLAAWLVLQATPLYGVGA